MNYNEIKKMLQNSGKASVDQSINEEISVHINISKKENGKIKLNAYLINNSPRYRLVGIKEANTTTNSVDTLEYTIRNTCNRLSAAYAKQNGSNQKNTKRNGRIVELLRSCDDIFDSKNYNAILPKNRHWGSSTTKSSVDYLLHSIAPELDAILSEKDEIDEDDIERMIKELVDHAYKSKRGKKCADGGVSEKQYAQTKANVTRRLERASIVYTTIREKHPELNLPDIPFPVFEFEKVVYREHPKAFADEIRIIIARLLYRLCVMGLPYAFSGWLEFGQNLRAAEAIAPLFVELNTKRGNYFVDTQVKDGVRTPILKSDPAKRYIFFLELTKKIIGLSRKRFLDFGLSDEEISKAFFSANVSTPDKPLDESKHSAFLLDVFKLAGCDDAFIAMMQQELYQEIDRANGDVDNDLSGHMARRDWASRTSNGGIGPVDVDAEIGHENDLVAKNDYATEDTARRRARENECAYVFDPDNTMHPYYNPIVLDKSKRIHLSGINGCSFVAEQDCTVWLDMTTLEANNGLRLVADRTVDIGQVEFRAPRDKRRDRKNRLILGKLQDEEWMREIIRKADQIDIMPIFRKYGGG